MANPSPDESSAEEYRALFEEHARSRGLSLTRARIGAGYYLSDTNEAWHAWLAVRATPPSPSTAPEVDERAAFEKEFKLDQFQRRPHAVIAGDYQESSTQCAWNGWQARAALASRPAEVDDEGLPPLPLEVARASKGEVAFFVKWSETGKALRGQLLLFTAEQFRQGQRDAVAADRARVGRAMGLLREARAALETWKDVAPAVSLCADIDKVLAGGAR